MINLKFRIWNKKSKCWGALSLRQQFLSDGILNLGDEDVEIQQSTGLKDSKGKEIYEGDILDDITYDQRYVITWSKELGVLYPRIAHWNEETITNDQVFELVILNQITNKGYIIGNIFENPELLK